jgi:hypothetical protein
MSESDADKPRSYTFRPGEWWAIGTVLAGGIIALTTIYVSLINTNDRIMLRLIEAERRMTNVEERVDKTYDSIQRTMQDVLIQLGEIRAELRLSRGKPNP